MTKDKPEALVQVKKGASNFTMEDCDFELGDSKRPAILTKAENTDISKTKFTTTSAEKTSGFRDKFLWKIAIPLAIAVAAGVILIFMFGT